MLIVDDIVGGIGAAIAAYQGDRLARADVLVAEGACCRDCQGIASNQTGVARVLRADAGAAGAVIDLVGSGDASDVDDAADHHSLGRDVGRGAGLIGDGVVAHVRAAVAAGKRYRLASANVLAVKHPAGRDGERVTGYQPCVGGVAGIHTGRAVGVIDLAGRADAAHAQRLLRYIGRGASLIDDGVVTHIGAAVAAGQIHCLGRAHVLVTEGSRSCHVDHVTCYQSCLDHASSADARCVAAVIDLAGCRDAADSHRLGCDVGCGAGLIGNCVIAHVRAAVAAGKSHSLATAHVPVVELACCRNNEGISRDQTSILRASVNNGSNYIAVIDLVGRGDAADGQGLLRDAGRRGWLIRNVVVAKIRAAVAAKQRHCLACADVLVVKLPGGGNAQLVTRHQAAIDHVLCADAGIAGAVVNLIGSRNTADGQHARNGQRLRCDAGSGALLIGDGVVAYICAAVAAHQCHSLACAYILGVELACGGNAQTVTADQARVGGARCARACHAVAVIDLVGNRDAAQAQRFLRDAGVGCCLVGDAVVADIGAAVGAGQSHRLAHANILVVSRVTGVTEGATCGDAECVAGHQATSLQNGGCDASGADSSKRVGVVSFGTRCDAGNRQRLGCDVRGHCFTGNQAVVAGQAVGAIRQTNRVDRHQVGSCDILAVEARSRAGAQCLCAHQTGGDRHRRRRRGVAVVNLVRCSHCGGKRLGRDVRGHRFTGDQAVVAGQAVGAIRQTDRVDRHQIRSRDVLGVKGRRGAGAKRFATHQPGCGNGHCRRGRATTVVHLVGGGDRGAQCLGRDVRGHGFPGSQAVVARQSAIGSVDKAHCVHRDQIRSRDILGVKGRRGTGAKRFATHQPGCGNGHCRRGRATTVVHLVGCGYAGAQCLGRDGGRGGHACRAQRVVACGRAVAAGDARDGQPAHRDQVGRSHVFAVVYLAGVGQRGSSVVGCQIGKAVARRDGCCHATVIPLGGAGIGQRRRDAARTDGYRRMSNVQRRQRVIAGHTAVASIG